MNGINVGDIDSLWLFERLKKLDLLRGFGSWWWEGAPSFRVVCEAVLVQNSRWEGVLDSMANLTKAGILSNDDEESLNNLAKCANIQSYIMPSRLYRQKSARLIALSQAIVADFGSFLAFKQEVGREWLLAQKGIGKESADAILNYACEREIMVVDRYSYKLLCGLGVEIEEYDELQAWFMGLDFAKVATFYEDCSDCGCEKSMSLAQIYARYHGKIVEFSKRKMDISAIIAH